MKNTEMKSMQSIGVKAYANLIGKSDKTVYKMIKDGLISAKKGKSGYKVSVDSYVLEGYNDINKELSALNDTVKDLSQRLKKLESLSEKKKTVLKSPVKKTVKKKVAIKKPSIKKPLKKALKKAGKKSTVLKK